jgi:hypothetical protein
VDGIGKCDGVKKVEPILYRGMVVLLSI